MVIRIGRLRERVTIKRGVPTRDPLGGNTVVETDLMDVWASVEVPRSRDGIVAMSETEIRTHEIVIRFSDTPAMNDVVVWGTTRLLVRNLRPLEDKRWLVLECVPDGQ